jgi:hypothetical protein
MKLILAITAYIIVLEVIARCVESLQKSSRHKKRRVWFTLP